MAFPPCIILSYFIKMTILKKNYTSTSPNLNSTSNMRWVGQFSRLHVEKNINLKPNICQTGVIRTTVFVYPACTSEEI